MFTIKFSDNGLFTDYSLELENYLQDNAVIEMVAAEDKMMVAAEDKIFIGYYKPFNTLYIEMSEANTNAGEMSIKYYNGTDFTAIDSTDKSKQMTRSGFVKWDKPSDWASSLINTVDKYWIEVSASTDFSVGTSFAGINIVFSDDYDLLEKSSEIARYKGSANSFIAYHQGARNEIVQEIRNSGRYKISGDIKTDLNALDILEPEQLREASKYIALKEIYFDKSDHVDDKYFQKYIDYDRRAKAAMNVYLLAIDSDDDGAKDTSEAEAVTYTRISRP